MKTIAYFFKIVLISLTLIIGGCADNTQFTTLDGEEFSESDFKGKWLIINFWAEWCAPCLEEIPDLNQLALRGSEMNLSVIGISFDPLANDQLKEVVSKIGIEYAVMATTPSPILSYSLPPTLPTNYVINPDGEVVVKLVGKQTYESLKNAVDKAKTNYN
jgi:thiol-disulfide isomerase/thioredoxin